LHHFDSEGPTDLAEEVKVSGRLPFSRPRGRRLNRRTALGGAGALALSLAACSTGKAPNQSSSGSSGAVASETPQRGGTLNFYVTRNYRLDPQQGSGVDQTTSSGVMSRIFKLKTSLDPRVADNHDIEPDLGLSAESPDAITWTIKLRPDAKFHNVAPVNGHTVEAEDIKATFTRAFDPKVPNPNRGTLGMIDPNQIQTPDKTTVVFKLKYPYAPLRKLLASAAYSQIFAREVLNPGYDPLKTIIGSGPWLYDSSSPDVGYNYKRNPDWFEKGMPYADNLKLAIIPEDAQQLAQFTSGALDYYLLTNPFNVDAVTRQNPRAAVLKTEMALPTPLYIQLGDPASVFQDIRVRRAFSMAIDRDALSKALLAGQAKQMVFMPSYMGKWALEVRDMPADAQQYYKFNPAETKKLLEAAGQSNMQLKLAYYTPTTPERQKIAETVNNMLNSAGIKTTIAVIDFEKDYIDAGKGYRQGYFPRDTVVSANAPVYSDADEYLFSYFHSTSTTNQEMIKDPDLDKMIEHERTLVNEDERLAAVKDATVYISQKMYTISTVGSYQWVYVNPRIQNFQYSQSIAQPEETFPKAWIRA
jgi:peptide/nickel transport system substrate-binding protein